MENLITEYPWVIAIIMLWTIPWKGMALWRSARRGHTEWFVILLIFNTLAILDILYIFIFSKNGKKEEPKREEKPNMNLPVKIIQDPVRKNNIV